MKFLDKKEQIIDLQLTQYGKYLISNGKFKPVYYAFFDDNILYDGNYAKISEPQNNIQTRIKSTTPQLATQHVFTGVETEFKKLSKLIKSSKEGKEIMQGLGVFPPRIQSTKDKQYSLQYSIGTSDLNSEYIPAWNITFLEGKLTSSATQMTSSYNTANIPQLTPSSIKYKTMIKPVSASAQGINSPTTFGDHEIAVLTDEGALLLDVSQANSFFGNDNYDIEVYEIEEEDVSGTIGPLKTKKEILNPLYFIKPSVHGNIVDGILKTDEATTLVFGDDAKDPFTGEYTMPLDPTYVEYFLNIEVDTEIDPKLLCELTVDKSQGIFGEKVIECEELTKEIKHPLSYLYETDVDDEDLGDCGE